MEKLPPRLRVVLSWAIAIAVAIPVGALTRAAMGDDLAIRAIEQVIGLL